MIDLSPMRAPEELIDALYEVRRGDRHDLQRQVERPLSHPEPIVREEAVALLLTKWRAVELREAARKVLQEDDDSGVRSRVAVGLASVSRGPEQSEDAKLLADTYKDRRSPQELKRSCHEALSLIYGWPTHLR